MNSAAPSAPAGRRTWPGLRDPRRLVRRAFARGIAAPPRRSPSDWAEAERILGPEEGPYPGPWKTSRVPYLREIMEVMSLNHPCRRVTFKASSQVGKTMATLNFAGQVIAENPTTVFWVLPSLDEAGQFNREKLEPMLGNSPSVRAKLKALVSRDETGSTTKMKRFAGGSIELTGANSSKGLQMRTKQVVILDELSEFPFDVDGRGDPVGMAEARTLAWTGREKILAVSTPGLKGSCRITKRYNEGSAGRYVMPCPHCGHRQALLFENLKWEPGHPEKAFYLCDSGNGCVITSRDKLDMLQHGEWVHEHPERLAVHPSYALNALYSPFLPFDVIAKKAEDSKDNPREEKVFVQQWKGEEYEPRFDVPSHELLWRRREEWPSRRIPPGVLFLMGAVDVQGNRLEWAVYGFDRHFGQYWIDGGILEGDPAQRQVWLDLDEVLARRYADSWGREWPVEAFGIDSGYLSQRVYSYCRRHAHQAEPRVMALDGRHRWGEPAIGAAKPMDVSLEGRKVGEVLLWPVGTWDIKTELASALRLTELGPDESGAWPHGAMRFPRVLDIGFFEEMTSEACVEVDSRGGFTRREWRKLRKNEQWDLAVYTRALARHETADFTEGRWDALAASRMAPPEQAQADMAALWAPSLKAEAEAAVAAAQPPPASASEPEPEPEQNTSPWGAPPAWGALPGW